MKIGVFVGSFNPVHKGHMDMVNISINKKIVDKVLIIPTGNYWNKNNIIDINHRINMLEQYSNENIIIEKELNNLQYTYQIINKLKDRYKDSELYLILGADNIISFDKWKEYKKLLKLNLIIFNRDNINVKKYLKRLNKKDKYIILNTNTINVSSTYIRDNINNLNILNELLDHKVLDYIIKNKLYKEDKV